MSSTSKDLEKDIKQKQEAELLKPPGKLLSLTYSTRLTPYQGHLAQMKTWLRPMFPKDYKRVRACFEDAENMKYFGPGLSWGIGMIHNFIYTKAYINLAKERIIGWTVITHDGIAGCIWATPKPDNKIEIGYCCHPAFANKKITSAAGQAVIDYIQWTNFEGLVFATVHPDNIPSAEVLKKIGLKPDPQRQNVWNSDYRAPRSYYQRDFNETPAILSEFANYKQLNANKSTGVKPSLEKPKR